MNNTALHNWHIEHGGRMVDFAGWDMPIQYTTITEEHYAVRQRAGLFDIAHMGRLTFSGPDAEMFLDRLLTNSVPKIKLGQVRYSLVCNEQGGILDDVLIYRFPDHFLLVVNASNREKIVAWIEEHRGGFDIDFQDLTLDTFMLALQGPRSLELLGPLTSGDPGALKYYSVAEMDVCGIPGVVSRTGYTGEDGFEVIVPQEHGQAVWEQLFSAGQACDLIPCGLGCRDTLRLEAAMPLYGHEMNEQMDPFTAGLAFGVRLDGGEFFGKTALKAAADRTDRPVRIGLKLDGKRIAREGSDVCSGEVTLGQITSGTFSPTLEQPIAMAYVPQDYAAPGTTVEVDIRGKRVPATVVALPFYSRKR
ncbi:MAG: glycine cleavage system aminomethyltransferase GcvT [Planctomycetaceae bacterium]|nr:glycine cleavage system aminomethyltransferase GcvT [Planctomycetaceae bacterium]